MPNKKGFASILIVLGIIILVGVIASIAFFLFRPNQNSQNNNANQYQTMNTGQNMSQNNFAFNNGNGSRDFAVVGDGGDSSAKDLPACTTNAIFDHAPTSDDNTIEGLGHTFAEHILPVQADHIYLYPQGNDANVNVYSPGDVTLVQVAAQKHTGGSDVGLGTDYSYFFSPCKSVMFGYLHVHTISDRIQKAISSVKPNCGNQGSLASNCVYQDLGLKLTSGEIIGTAWGSGKGLDFGGTDIRTPVLGFINKQDYTGGMMADSYTHTICPLDYFTDSLKSQLFGKINIKNANTNGIGPCGSVMQDKAGTAQGNWYMQGISYTYQGDNLTKILAFAHYNLDPSQAVISAGAKLLPSSDFGAQIIYQPRTGGVINPDPANIKPDNRVYCIEGQVTISKVNAHVDIQMPDANTLKADYKTGSCAANPVLSNSITYSR